MFKTITGTLIVFISLISMNAEISADIKNEMAAFVDGCLSCLEHTYEKSEKQINHSMRYKINRYGSGLDRYLVKAWGEEGDKKMTDVKARKYRKPSDEEIRKKLTDLQYKVTQKEGTERAFDNEYWDNKREGIYVDIVSGEPLFSSTDKYKSGTGWPSFTKPIDKEFIVEKEDRKLFRVRTEIRSKYGDSHLGHVFNDGPEPTGLRYCMNSASLRFIPKEDMEKEGYGEYLKLFDE